MEIVISALLTLGIIGAIFGIVLTIADKKFAVEIDPRVSKIKDLLGGANCGACGFAGCDAFAEAVVSGEAKPNGCPAANAELIGKVMGVDVKQGEKMVARVLCQGTEGIAKSRFEYDGYASCKVAASFSGGPKLCRFACIGLGDCMKVCGFDAISIKNGVAHINEKKCVGCGNCINACPRGAIKLEPADTRVLVFCRNSDTGRVARTQCMKACIACQRCIKECKYDAISIVDGYARIDTTKCTRCGECAKVCPCGCIVDITI